MMKRTEVVVVVEKKGMVDFPEDLWAEILLRYVNFRLDSTKIWHRMECLFRMIPTFGRSEVKTLFYQKITHISPDLFRIFYRTMEYPPFLGLVKFQPNFYTEEPHLVLLPRMLCLKELDLSGYHGKIDIKSVTNLTSLSCNDFVEDEDLLLLGGLRKLSIGETTKLTNRGFGKLGLLEEFSIEPRVFYTKGTPLTIEIFGGMCNLRVLKIGTGHIDFYERFKDFVFTDNLLNLTRLWFGGPLNTAGIFLHKLPNLRNLHIEEEFFHHDCGHFSTLFHLEELSSGKKFEYRFDENDLKGLSRIHTISIERDYVSVNELPKFTTLTSLSFHNNVRTFGMNAFDSLTCLTNLKSLSFCVDRDADHQLSKLENLTHLNLIGNQKVSDRCLLKMTNLTRLDFALSAKISRNAINRLPNLSVFGIPKRDQSYLQRMVSSLDREVEMIDLL